MAIRAINIKFPMIKGTAGAFETNKTTLDAIKSNLKILILSNYGERSIQYDFGANLRELIFNHQGPQLGQAIKDNINRAIEKWMPFVTVNEIEVAVPDRRKNVNENEIKIFIKFSVGQLTDDLKLPIRL